jgi:hypothetical protein
MLLLHQPLSKHCSAGPDIQRLQVQPHTAPYTSFEKAAGSDRLLRVGLLATFLAEAALGLSQQARGPTCLACDEQQKASLQVNFKRSNRCVAMCASARDATADSHQHLDRQ